MLFEPRAKRGGPWAAALADPLAEQRIPVTTRAEGDFLVAFDSESEARPTDWESALIVSFTQFVRTEYADHVQDTMAAKAFDYIGGRNTVLLHKYGTDSWGFRRWSWESTPFFVPDPHIQNPPETLLQVLHRAEHGHRWEAWKAARADLFERPPGACGDLACKTFEWSLHNEIPGTDGPVLLCVNHHAAAPGWAYEVDET